MNNKYLSSYKILQLFPHETCLKTNQVNISKIYKYSINNFSMT